MDGLDLPLWWQKFDHESSLHCLWPSEATERAAKARGCVFFYTSTDNVKQQHSKKKHEKISVKRHSV